MRSTVDRILNQHLQLACEKAPEKATWTGVSCNWPTSAIQMDTIDFGDVYSFTAIDTFTREGQAVMRPSLTSHDGASVPKEVMSYSGGCKVLQKDGGSEIEGEFLTIITITPASIELHDLIARMSRLILSVSAELFVMNSWAGPRAR